MAASSLQWITEGLSKHAMTVVEPEVPHGWVPVTPRVLPHVQLSATALADRALEELVEGNNRFLKGNVQLCVPDPQRLQEVAAGQAPSAVVVCCSDARAPPELIFDQGMGDVFVVRCAGNVVNDHALGSIAFAVENLGARLVVVMGHSRCNACQLSLDSVRQRCGSPPHRQQQQPIKPCHPTRSIVDSILPAIEQVAEIRSARSSLDCSRSGGSARSSLEGLSQGMLGDGADVVEEVVKLNAQMTADIIVQRLEQSLPYTILPEIRVLSAKYEVTTGKVHFHGDGSTPRVLMHALCSIDEQDSGASSAEEDPVAVGTVRSRAQAVHGRQLTSAVPLVAIPLAAVAAAGYLLFCNKT